MKSAMATLNLLVYQLCCSKHSRKVFVKNIHKDVSMALYQRTSK
ncbi:hypothetical protein X975_05658, partial [Stegodyphus mimosarum]